MRLCKKEDFLSIKYGKNKLPKLHSFVENLPPPRYNGLVKKQGKANKKEVRQWQWKAF